ncbi:mycobacterial membrane protein [Mycolicibacterium rhodesiae NBB3]|uniref:Mycobacterial membrane protein n=1 Tax=Mycolicibacterium rhodesiae (strain NBB3) TaxID=710685 RepID=G8RHA9_MYCRN|nr:MmpS family transport accessory protein [Mycolicibacterium rhodesiae]AEV74589.1 mycobacterial membrane protein [Mycolicibacterium rhodesiae NBB3]
MTDSPHRGPEEQPGFREGPAPTQPQGNYPGYGGYTDPAYASQAQYGPPYQAPGAPPTEQMPYGYDPYASGQYTGQFPAGGPGEPPPEEPKSPRWLWVLATTAVLAVIGLVIALVIVYDSSSRQETVVAPPPSLPEPSTTTRTSPPTTSRTPSTSALPAPTVPSAPPTTGTTAAGPTETVLYDVAGEGRAINITYVDNGGLLQTEFNVLLPWSKQVQLPEPANASASISIINVGREVNCSISINGAIVEQRSGAGLTICTATG